MIFYVPKGVSRGFDLPDSICGTGFSLKKKSNLAKNDVPIWEHWTDVGVKGVWRYMGGNEANVFKNAYLAMLKILLWLVLTVSLSDVKIRSHFFYLP